MSKPSAPGFNAQPTGYPPVVQQPGYPGAQQPSYPVYPQYPQQPAQYPPQQAQHQHPPLPQQPYSAPMQPFFNNGQWASTNLMQTLATASTFVVKQKLELLEIVTGFETGNKYVVKDQAGNKIFYVEEESGFCNRWFCGSNRSFNLHFKDMTGQTVMICSREIDCGCCFGLFCPDEVLVKTASGLSLGSIREESSCFKPMFRTLNASGQTILRIEGPVCACGHVTFEVMNLNGVQVGSIKKEWGGVVREIFTDADTFSISFPPNLEPESKAVMLGALFMIDFHYFERSGNAAGSEGGRRWFS